MVAPIPVYKSPLQVVIPVPSSCGSSVLSGLHTTPQHLSFLLFPLFFLILFCFSYYSSMAKAQASRLVMEVAPPQLVSVVRRKVTRILDTIKEEERDAMENFSPVKRTPSSLFMRELQKSFSIHGHEWLCADHQHRFREL